MIDEGDTAPALSATTSDGETIAIGSPRQPLALYFYLKDRNGSYEGKTPDTVSR